MMTQYSSQAVPYRLLYFSEIVKSTVYIDSPKQKLGPVSDLIFQLTDPYPECVGILIEHGWGKPSEFVPWDHILRIEKSAIFVKPPDEGETYPPFVDQTGWILIEKHLMGRTILDMDGRRTEVVNDVHMLESKGRIIIVHVDVSFNGFLRRWGLRKIKWVKDRLISWKYVQPLSLEDAVQTDKVSLSITREDMKNLPSEDLADVLEELSGEEQQALFSALDSEKAAETLTEAEPRAQRQIIANIRKEHARGVLSEMSMPQLADLFSVLPHDDVTELLDIMPPDQAEKLKEILSQREVQASSLMSQEYVTVQLTNTAREVMDIIRQPGRDPDSLSYIYVLNDMNILEGVVDLRELVLAPEEQRMEDLMTSPVVSADQENTWEELAELFAKYRWRMLPVVDSHDRIKGAIHYHEIMKGQESRTKG